MDALCPLCRHRVAFETVAWVACGGCLVRHHASCWSESRCCASCGDPRSLSLAERPASKGHGRLLVAATLLLAGAASAGGFFFARAMDGAAEKKAAALLDARLDAALDRAIEHGRAAPRPLVVEPPAELPVSAKDGLLQLLLRGLLTEDEAARAQKQAAAGLIPVENVVELSRFGRLLETGSIELSDFETLKRHLLFAH